MDEEKIFRRRIGKAFRGLRIKKRFTQADFAYEAGIDRSYYAKIEKGSVGISLEMTRRIAKALDFKFSRLMRVIERVLN